MRDEILAELEEARSDLDRAKSLIEQRDWYGYRKAAASAFARLDWATELAKLEERREAAELVEA